MDYSFVYSMTRVSVFQSLGYYLNLYRDQTEDNNNMSERPRTITWAMEKYKIKKIIKNHTK